MLKRIVVIHSNDQAPWQSCQSISNNLMKVYHSLAESKQAQVEFIGIRLNATMDEVYRAAIKANDFKPDRIVWLEYKPTPATFLKSYDQLQSTQAKLPEIVVHIYGDFILNISDWRSMEELLKKYPIVLRCASSKQQGLVDRFLITENKMSDVSPFPVDKSFFKFDSSLRKEGRAKYGLKDDEIVFLYSGRLSYQKNIFHLLHLMKDAIQLSSEKFKLLLAGPMDDLGMPYVGLSGPLNAFFGQFKTVRKNLEKLFENNQIQLLGNVPQSELNELYCASDFQINLSTHNDEDYGMAPAEGLCAGLPALLTAWGGFCDFHTYCPDHVKLIPLVREKGRFLPSYKDALKEMMNTKIRSDQERALIAEQAQNHLSVEKVVGTSMHCEPSKLQAFNEKFYKTLACFENVKEGPFRGPRGELNEFYFELYNLYGEIKNDK